MHLGDLRDMVSSTRTFLQCPYEEKDVAKGLGAKWEPRVRKWYAQPQRPAPADRDGTQEKGAYRTPFAAARASKSTARQRIALNYTTSSSKVRTVESTLLLQVTFSPH